MLYVSTSAINSIKTIECVEKCAQITNNIELSGGCDYEGDLLVKLIAVKKRMNLNFLLHAYFPPPKEHFIMNFAENSKRTRAFIEDGAAYVEALDIPYYSVHAGFKKTYGLNKEVLIDSSDGNAFTIGDIEKAVSYFTMSYPEIKLVLENLYPTAGMNCCFMMHIEEITEILDRFPGIYLLLDLGHLKISSRSTGFNYAAAVEILFEKYADRIMELHLSENDALTDRHWPIYTDSVQYLIVKNYVHLINKSGINVVIETRNSDFDEVKGCFQFINGLIG